MDKKEFSQLVMAMRTYYPKENLLPNNQAMELWYMQLQDIPYQLASEGLNKWVATNKWAPTIADIREMAVDMTSTEENDWGKAWESVMMAIRRYGFYNTEVAIESLDEITRQCVKRLGFQNLCMSENIAVDRANFRMIYEQTMERKMKEAQIPQRTKDLMEKVKNQALLGKVE